jgi:hypothetical protein
MGLFILYTCSDGQWMRGIFSLTNSILPSVLRYSDPVWDSKEGRPQVRLRSKDLRLCTAHRMTLKKPPRTTHAVLYSTTYQQTSRPLTCTSLSWFSFLSSAYNSWNYYLQNYRRSCSLQETIPCRTCGIPLSVSCMSETYDSYLQDMRHPLWERYDCPLQDTRPTSAWHEAYLCKPYDCLLLWTVEHVIVSALRETALCMACDYSLREKYRTCDYPWKK